MRSVADNSLCVIKLPPPCVPFCILPRPRDRLINAPRFGVLGLQKTFYAVAQPNIPMEHNLRVFSATSFADVPNP